MIEIIEKFWRINPVILFLLFLGSSLPMSYSYDGIGAIWSVLFLVLFPVSTFVFFQKSKKKPFPLGLIFIATVFVVVLLTYLDTSMAQTAILKSMVYPYLGVGLGVFYVFMTAANANKLSRYGREYRAGILIGSFLLFFYWPICALFIQRQIRRGSPS